MNAKTIPTCVTVVGAFLVLLVWTLSALEVGKFGQETDIGGGVILLLGYLLTLGGIVSLIKTRLTRHRSRRG